MTKEASTTLTALLERARNLRASDLRLQFGVPPVVLINDEVEFLGDRPLDSSDLEYLIMQSMNEREKDLLERDRQVDYALHPSPTSGRFRANVAYQRGSLFGTFRVIPERAPSLDQLGLPKRFGDLVLGYDRGLVLVTGRTGSGKSTTLAALLSRINDVQNKMIITIEDPVEYYFESNKSVIVQRQVGTDVMSFEAGLVSALRQKPNIIMVGEIRTVETARAALDLADTGHLVLGTLHTGSAAESVQRLFSFFSANDRSLRLDQLARNLRLILAQRLLKRTGQSGLVAAVEMLVANGGFAGALRNGDMGQVQNYKDENSIPLEQSLMNLVRQRLIDPEDARQNANDLETMRALLNQAGL